MNKVKFGLKNVHYAPISTSADGEITFGTPVAIPGAVSLSMDAQGDTQTFYADDVAYSVTTGNDGYSGTLEIAVIPDHFRKTILGETEDETSHVLVENAFAEPKPFALLYEVSGDEKASRRVMYNCSVGRPGENAKTNEKSKTPQTDTMNLTASALADGSVRARTTESTPSTVFDNWYKSVWRPAATATQAQEVYPMETSVTIDGREVRFRATAAVPRLYRIKFRRDILQDFQAVQKAIERAQETAVGGDVSEAAPVSTLTLGSLELFEDMAYIMAKHADPQGVPSDPDEWLESFGTFSIYGVFPVIRALWEQNTEALDIAKKKLEQSTGR